MKNTQQSVMQGFANQPNKNQTVIVTGAAGGMGRQTCLYLAQLGWHVLAVDHNEARLTEYLTTPDSTSSDDTTLDTIALDTISLNNIVILPIELAADDLVDRVNNMLDDMSPLWGLVNLAGVSIGNDIEHLSEEDWQLSMDVNVTAPYRLIQGTYQRMQETGMGGSIINVTSPVGYIGARKPSYAASKAALHGLTTSCARNLGQYNIRVNLLLPGTTITEMTKDWNEARRTAIAKESLLGRLCTPQEIAEGIAFLLSEHSRYMSGSILDMTCGSMWGH